LNPALHIVRDDDVPDLLEHFMLCCIVLQLVSSQNDCLRTIYVSRAQIPTFNSALYKRCKSPRSPFSEG